MTAWLSPFHVLGVPTSATREEIVQRADELARGCGSDEERNLIAWAEGELTKDPVLRARYEWTEPRHTDYARQQRWEEFVRDFTGNPVTTQSLAADGGDSGGDSDSGADSADGGGSRLRAEDVDLPSAVRILIRRAADAGIDAIDPLFRTMPADDADGVPRLEIRDVLFG